MIREVTFLTDVTVTLISDRVKFHPWGIAGGGEGVGNRFWIETPEGRRPMKSKDFQRVKAGDTLSLHTTGGGGYGDPRERNPDAVRRDVATEKSARARQEGLRLGRNPPGRRRIILPFDEFITRRYT